MLFKMKFVLHIGAHRTGTSYIQETLDLNIKKFLKKNTVSLTPPRISRRKRKTFRSLGKKLQEIGSTKYFFSNFFSFIFLRFNLCSLILRSAGFRPVNTVIISEENLLGKVFLGKNRKFYPHAELRLRGLKLITGDRIKEIYLCIRSYETFIISYYSMSALYSEVLDFESISKTWINFSGGWYDVIKSIAKLFPNAAIYVYEYENTSPKKIFLKIAKGFSFPFNWPKNKINIAPSESAIRKAISF